MRPTTISGWSWFTGLFHGLRGAAAIAAVLLALRCAAPGAAAEMQLRGECRISGNVVKLGDVAEIRTADSAQRAALAAIDLTTVTASESRLVLSARQVQDLLALRGVNLAEHRFSGARRVTIAGRTAAAPLQQTTQPPSVQQARQAQRKLQTALNDSLVGTLPAGSEWGLQAELAPAQIQAVLSATQIKRQMDGAQLSAGAARELVYQLTTPQGESQLAVKAELAAPPMFVVAAHNIARGQVLRAADLRLAPGTPASGASRVISALDEAIGKQTTRSLVVGQMLDEPSLRRPVLVQKNQIVKVYSLAEGVQVETKARAKEDGSLGDLVSVESIAERKGFLARVSGESEVEVVARPMTLRPVAAADETPALAADSRKVAQTP